jgi:hypothetical protein
MLRPVLSGESSISMACDCRKPGLRRDLAVPLEIALFWQESEASIGVALSGSFPFGYPVTGSPSRDGTHSNARCRASSRLALTSSSFRRDWCNFSFRLLKYHPSLTSPSQHT